MRTVLVCRAARGAGVVVLCLLAASCFTAPERPFSGPDPSDPAARAAVASYRPVLSGYRSQRPVDPLPWRERNEQVAPKPKR
jgi:hypothetical protein